MINVDLTKAFQPRSFQLLTPFIPGLSFEFSLVWGKPDVVKSVLMRTDVDKYVFVAAALLGAFVVGSAFFFWARLIEILMLKAYTAFSMWWPEQLKKLNERAIKKPFPPGVPGKPHPPRSLYFKALTRALHKQRIRELQIEHTKQALGKTISTVLRRWGIENPGQNMAAWSGVIGVLRPDDVRSPSLVMGLQAVGWSGIVAHRLAPGLGPLYLALCLFLIAYGLVASSSVAWRLSNPGIAWMISLRNAAKVLRETRQKSNKSSADDSLDDEE